MTRWTDEDYAKLLKIVEADDAVFNQRSYSLAPWMLFAGGAAFTVAVLAIMVLAL